MTEAFEKAWEAIKAGYPETEIERTRLRLARIVVAVAPSINDSGKIACLALRNFARSEALLGQEHL